LRISRGIQKTTADLIDGLELQVTEAEFTMRFLTIVPYFKVKNLLAVGCCRRRENAGIDAALLGEHVAVVAGLE
jgi:hypothetical protein